MSKYTTGRLGELVGLGPFEIGIEYPEGDERDHFLATVKCGDPDELAANARRLVACWNACEGLDTETIESRGVALRFDAALRFKDTDNTVFGEGAAIKQVAELHHRYEQAERERDELRAALKAIASSSAESTVLGLQQAAAAAVAKITTTSPRYTSVSKGGTYIKLGAIRGAGSLKGLSGIAYQNEQGQLFIREPECLAKRMVLIPAEAVEGGAA